MSIAVQPTDYMQQAFDPISKDIDSYGGAHTIIGCIASGGAPHIYVVGNCKDSLQREIFEAIADNLYSRLGKAKTIKPTLVMR